MEITVLHSTESLFLFVILFYFYYDRRGIRRNYYAKTNLLKYSSKSNGANKNQPPTTRDRTRVELNEFFTLVCVYVFSIYQFDLANT